MAEEDLKRLLEDQHAETRRHFGELADRFERLEGSTHSE